MARWNSPGIDSQYFKKAVRSKRGKEERRRNKGRNEGRKETKDYTPSRGRRHTIQCHRSVKQKAHCRERTHNFF